MATAAKFPGALLALADVGGELPGFPEAVLSGAHNNSVATITLTATVPTAWPTAGWVTIDSEIIQYAGKSGATLTGCTRGSQSAYGGSASASHADTAKVGFYLTPQAVNQVIADLIALESVLRGSTPADVTLNGRLLLSPAAARVVGGATSLSLRNNADSADNVAVTDAGSVTTRLGLFTRANVNVSLNHDRYTLANNATGPLWTAKNSFQGIVYVSRLDSGRTAIFETEGGVNAVATVYASVGFSTTAAGAGTVNVYWSAGNTRYEIENKTGGSINVDIALSDSA